MSHLMLAYEADLLGTYGELIDALERYYVHSGS